MRNRHYNFRITLQLPAIIDVNRSPYENYSQYFLDLGYQATMLYNAWGNRLGTR